MAKFSEVESYQKNKGSPSGPSVGSDKENFEIDNALTEEELQQALKLDPNAVPLTNLHEEQYIRTRYAFVCCNIAGKLIL